MNIAMAIFRYFPYGGLQRDMMAFARCAVDRGHSVTVFCQSWEAPLPDWINMVQLDCTKMSSDGCAVEFERLFHGAVARRKPDVTWAFNRIGGCDYYFAGDNCIARSMARKHGKLALRLLPRYRNFLKLERKIFSPESQTVVFTIAANQRDEFIDEYGCDPARLIPLPPQTDTACFRPPEPEAQKIRDAMRKKAGIGDDRLLILLVGTNLMLKGADRMLRAVAALPDGLRRHCTPVLLGSDRGHHVARLAESLGFRSGEVLLPGVSDCVAKWLLAADLMVHPAREEAAGGVLLEATAAGLPTVTTGVCGFAPYIGQAGGIVLPEPFEQSALDAALPQALERRRELADHALAFAATGALLGRCEAALEYIEKHGRSGRAPLA